MYRITVRIRIGAVARFQRPIRVRIGPLNGRFGRRFESNSVFESAIRFGHQIRYPIRIPNRLSDLDIESGIRIGLNSEHIKSKSQAWIRSQSGFAGSDPNSNPDSDPDLVC